MSVFAGGKPEPIFTFFFVSAGRWSRGGLRDNNGNAAVSGKECVVFRH